MVAESIGHEDKFDLFRHTTLLGIEVESCIGYGHYVTEIACQPNKQKDMRTQSILSSSLPVANDCLVFYKR